MPDRRVFAERVLVDGRFAAGTVTLRDGRIAAFEAGAPHQAARRLAPDAILAPGFVDLQANGGGGIAVNDAATADEVVAVARAHRAGGTTALLATAITDRPGTMERVAALVAAARARPGGEAVAGIHLEGPFISRRRPGVHPAAAIRPLDEAEAGRLLAIAAGGVSLGAVMVTLAPEEAAPGAIRRLAAAGIVVAAGHTEATPATLAAARRDGLAGYTHLWNAMPPLAGRAPGPVGACLDDDGAWCGLIADGIHVDALTLRLVLARKPAGAVVLVTDAMPVAGTSLDRFAIGGRLVLRRDGALRTADDGTLAGADLTMAAAVRHAVSLGGATPEAALAMATANPARAAGLADRGRIAPGLRADLVELTDGLAVGSVCLGGVWLDD